MLAASLRRLLPSKQCSTMPMPQDPANATSALADEDMALARRAASADVAAFELLYRRHHRRVLGVIARGSSIM